MADETYEYKGHMIAIDLTENRQGWSWSYMIDGKNFIENADRRLKSKDVILAEAKTAAEQRVNAMK